MADKRPPVERKPAKGVNKSEAIRTLAREMQDKGEKPRPVLIVDALRRQGIAVSSPQVSMVLKKMGFQPRPRRKAAGAATPAAAAGVGQAAISVDELIAAKKLVGQFGGVERALAAIAALKRFES